MVIERTWPRIFLPTSSWQDKLPNNRASFWVMWLWVVTWGHFTRKPRAMSGDHEILLAQYDVQRSLEINKVVPSKVHL